MATTSCPEGFVDLVDAKDDVVKAENRTDLADALLTVERRITMSTYRILGMLVSTVGIATAIVLSAFQALSQT